MSEGEIEAAWLDVRQDLSIDRLREFRDAARALKASEVEHRACQERYAAAVRALSEEAVK